MDVYGCNDGISGIVVKELSEQSVNYIVNRTVLTLLQMIDISTKLMSEWTILVINW